MPVHLHAPGGAGDSPGGSSSPRRGLKSLFDPVNE